jgi:hypothetical protein
MIAEAASAGLSVETLDKLWENYTHLADEDARAAQEEATEYARARYGQKGFTGHMVDAVIAGFGMFVYVYRHLGRHLLTPDEYEKEFAERLNDGAPVWVDWPYGKREETRLMYYGTVRRSAMRRLLDFRRVKVCMGPCPGGGVE